MNDKLYSDFDVACARAGAPLRATEPRPNINRPRIVNAQACQPGHPPFTCFLNPLPGRPVARFFANDEPQDFTARTLGRALRKARRAAGRSTAVIA